MPTAVLLNGIIRRFSRSITQQLTSFTACKIQPGKVQLGRLVLPFDNGVSPQYARLASRAAHAPREPVVPVRLVAIVLAAILAVLWILARFVACCVRARDGRCDERGSVRDTTWAFHASAVSHGTKPTLGAMSLQFFAQSLKQSGGAAVTSDGAPETAAVATSAANVAAKDRLDDKVRSS